MKASELLKVLIADVGYRVARQKRARIGGSLCDGRPPITWAYHDRKSLSPGEVRRVLVKQVGPAEDEALSLL